MLYSVNMNSGGNGGSHEPPHFDPDHDPDPGGQPVVPTVVELPFRRHGISSITTEVPHLRVA